MTQTSENLELFHYGVKGMRWGVRRPIGPDGEVTGPAPGGKGGSRSGTNSSGGDSASTTPKRSRKELRRINKEGRANFDQKKAEKLTEEALKNGGADTLISLRTPGTGPYPTVVTGREFVEYISKGGVFDVNTSKVYARKGKHEGEDAWLVDDSRPDRYKKVKR